jgi:5-bromo-4-chloroindolyl phosphate hydrolysis protein
VVEKAVYFFRSIGMIFVWGTRLYGKVDEVPGMFHVATRFFHLWYIPLIPMGSTVVLAKSGKSWRGVTIGLSAKSMLLAWARAGLIVGTFFTGITGMVMLTDYRPHTAAAISLIVLAAAMLAGAVATWMMRGLARAKYERAVELAEKIGMKEEGLVMIELAFKRVSEADAKATLEQLRADAEQMAELGTKADADELRHPSPDASSAAPSKVPLRA